MSDARLTGHTYTGWLVVLIGALAGLVAETLWRMG